MLEEQVHQPSDSGADTYAGGVGAAPMGQTDRHQTDALPLTLLTSPAY